MKKTIFLIILMAALFAIAVPRCGAQVLSAGAEQYDDYHRMEDTGVAVNATITKITEEEDYEGDKTYTAYITYSYNGQTFRNVKYKSVGGNSYYGKSVQVEIDPQNPAHLRPESAGVGRMVLGGLIILVGAVMATISITRRLSYMKVLNNWKEAYTSPILTIHAVYEDIGCENNYKRHYSVIVAGIVSAVILGVLTYNYLETNSYTASIGYGITLLIFLLFEYTYYKAHNEEKPEIRLVKDKFLRIEIEEDSDGNKTKFWVFSCGKRWRPQETCLVTLTGRMLTNIHEGKDVYIVLDKQDEIVRIYDTEEFRM